MGDSPLALNTAEHPQAVTIEQAVWRADTPLLTLPPHSFSLVAIPIR
jgi:hypothetical protein